MRTIAGLLIIGCLLIISPALAQEGQPLIHMPGGTPMQMDNQLSGPGLLSEINDQEGMRRERAYALQLVLRLTDLTDEQRVRLCQEAIDPLAKINQRRAELANLRLKYLCVQYQKKIDPQRIKEIYSQAGEIEAELIIAREAYVKIIRSILTTEQLERLDRMPPVPGRSGPQPGPFPETGSGPRPKPSAPKTPEPAKGPGR